MAKIAVHGFLNIDLLGRADRLAEVDQEVQLDELSVQSGGSAANVAVGLSRLGEEVYFLGAVGDDRYASVLIESLEGVRKDYLQQIPRTGSGTVMVIVDPQGMRTMYTYPGANVKYDVRKVPASFFQTLDWLHMSSPHPELAEHLYQAKRNNANLQISLDPSALLTKRGLSFLQPFLVRTDVLFLNEHELADLFPQTGTEQAIEALHRLGVAQVYVKRGSRGAISSFRTDGGTAKFSLPALQVPTVDSTGAGDAFAVGVLYGLLQGWSQAAVLAAGNELGALAVQRIGARAGLPHRLSRGGTDHACERDFSVD